MRKYRLPLIALLIISILLAACQSASPSGGQAQPTDIPPVVSPNQIVVDGRVVPADDVQLSFNTGGEVTDIRVKEGDVVKTGDVLASLGNRAQLEINPVQRKAPAALCPARPADSPAGSPGTVRYSAARQDGCPG